MRANNHHQKKLRKGLKNNYRADIPLAELVFKDLFFTFKGWANYFRNGLQHHTIHTYPEFPSRNATLYKICTALSINITNRPVSRYRLAVYWEDKTLRTPDSYIQELSQQTHVLNSDACDISKTFVEEAHQQAFGYSTRVDPATHHGPCVRKSNMNAAHDGEIVQCPVNGTEPGVVYQKLINNRSGDMFVEDIRVPVLGSTIPHVYLKYKPLEARFANFRETPDDRLPEIHPPEGVFSEEEIAQIKALAGIMHLEFGEMDVLRDRDDGKIYVVDVNNTPTGPSHLRRKDLKKAISNLAATFRKEFLS